MMAGRKLSSLTEQTVHAYLDQKVAVRTRTHASETGRSLSGIVNEALVAYFDRRDLIEAIDREALLQQTARKGT